MVNIDDINEIKKYDPKDVFGSTQLLPEQITQIREIIENVHFDPNLGQVKNIVVCGMGGSAYGGIVSQYLFKKQLSIPLVVNNDYTVPGFVDSDTLVILTSYSGSTEEILHCLTDVKSKNAKIIGITMGGKLAQTLLEQNLPVVTFTPQFNPSGQPRLGTGYIVFGTIEILRKIGVINLPQDYTEQLVEHLKQKKDAIQNEAKAVAQKIEGFIPVIFAAEHLIGAAHIMRNQFNETSKSFSAYSPIPELNHHLMEGLKNPQDKKLKVLFLESDLYSKIIKKRITLTKDVVEKNNIQVLEFKPASDDPLIQVFEVIYFGSFLTFYLAILYMHDPSLIPWVDYFKEKLAQ